MSDDVNGTQAETLDEAIAWCLSQRDSGTKIDEQVAVETFPRFAEEIRTFLREEKRFERALVQPLGEMSPSPPTSFGKYEFRRTIGSGAFGRVYLAWDTEMHRHVALKMARFACGDDVVRERFQHEARASAQLRHPNIVRIFDFGEIDDFAFLAMEFVDGATLAKWASDPVDPQEAVRVVAAIADALMHAHHRGIVHRDLTPKNIIVDAEGNPNILDYGLAKLVASDTTLVLSGDVVGTPSYVAPEQVSGKAHDVDGRADIYSLGVILYELLSGVRPFDGPLGLLLHQIRFEDPPLLNETDPSIPTRLVEICKKCMQKKPEDRYATAEGLLQDIQSFLREDHTKRKVADETESPVSSRLFARTVRNAVFSAVTVAALLFAAWGLGMFRTSNTNRVDDGTSGASIAVENTVDDHVSLTGELGEGFALVSSNTGFDFDGKNWFSSDERKVPVNEYISQRDWIPSSSNEDESTLGSAFLSIPAGHSKVGYMQNIDLESGASFQLLRIRAAIDGGWASFGVNYYDDDWGFIKSYEQRIRSTSGSKQGKGDGITLHQFGCEVPEGSKGAAIWVWREEANGSDLFADDFGLYDYTPPGDVNRIKNGELNIGEYTEKYSD